VIVLDPDPESPAGHFANDHLCAAFDNGAALDQMAGCAAVTTEFENAPAQSLFILAERCPVSPPGNVVEVAQDRIREKNFFRDNGFPVGPFAILRDVADFTASWPLAFPAILKTARFGYDGKGQARIADASAAQTQWDAWDRVPCVLEQFLPLAGEISVVLARGRDGETACFPVAENQHRHGILDTTIAPARVAAHVGDKAIEIATRLAERLEYVGVLAVEFFVLADDSLLINEIAPRPHNSGHFTIDACATSQFEQQVRTLCGLTLGDPLLRSPAVMVNLLGDVWQGGEPDWNVILSHPNVKLHLYGKREARPRRKMGHFTVQAESVETALAIAEGIKVHLGIAAV
jgi:5-(carboxyamino)imidazole ribonucleotide synthase